MTRRNKNAFIIPVLALGASFIIGPARAQSNVPGATALVSPVVMSLAAAQTQAAPPPQPPQAPAPPALGFNQVVDRAIESERRLMETLSSRQPVVETYVEEMQTDPELGSVPERDFYFLGKLDLRKGVQFASFIPAPAGYRKTLTSFGSRLVPGREFFPRGFASRMFIDEGFNRQQYQFEYVRREFIGDVRCIVIDVRPLKKAGKGRFEGRIWVEDRDYNVVRFNGSYGTARRGYLHFDSWRVNAGPNLWLPAAVYTEENDYSTGFRQKSIVRAQTRFWDYENLAEQTQSTFTNLAVDMPQGVKDQTDLDGPSPVEARRMWNHQAEDNVIARLERAGLISPAGDVDNVLSTVLNNLEVTNNLNIQPPVRVRIMLTTPLESISIGYTVVISRGLLDVLPDEASLAAVLAHELAHIALGQTTKTPYAFADRMLFDDTQTLKKISLSRTEEEEHAADTKALEILRNSPYKDKLSHAGLFLRMLSERAGELPHLLQPLIGDGLADANEHLRLATLMETAPELQARSTEQVTALPLGSRINLDPWSNQLRLLKTRNVPLVAASEKMPFELTPFMLYLHRQDEPLSMAVPVPAGSTVMASGKSK